MPKYAQGVLFPLSSLSHDPGSGLAGVLAFGDKGFAVAEYELGVFFRDLAVTSAIVVIGLRMFASGAVSFAHDCRFYASAPSVFYPVETQTAKPRNGAKSKLIPRSAAAGAQSLPTWP